jgi:hypothetical protein
MTTEKQKQSNRENAKHSTGPKTDQGKQRSSKNALKHGIYAIESVIPGEDPADFDELCTEFGERYDPDGPYERSLVRQRADAEWRMRRIMRLEADFLKHPVELARERHIERHPDQPEPDLSLLRGGALQTRTIELQRFARYEDHLSRRQRQAHKSLMECRRQEAQRDAPPSPTTRADRPIPDHRVPDHTAPREPFYHPAGDPRIQHNEVQQPTQIPPSQTKSTTSDPPGSKTSDENAA